MGRAEDSAADLRMLSLLLAESGWRLDGERVYFPNSSVSLTADAPAVDIVFRNLAGEGLARMRLTQWTYGTVQRIAEQVRLMDSLAAGARDHDQLVASLAPDGKEREQ